MCWLALEKSSPRRTPSSPSTVSLGNPDLRDRYRCRSLSPVIVATREGWAVMAHPSSLLIPGCYSAASSAITSSTARSRASWRCTARYADTSQYSSIASWNSVALPVVPPLPPARRTYRHNRTRSVFDRTLRNRAHVSRSRARGPAPECMSRVPTVGHVSKGFGHTPQDLGHLTRLRRVRGGQLVEQRYGISRCRPLGHTTCRWGLRQPKQKVVAR